MEGDGFGVEPVGFEVLMNFSKARHAGLELSRGPVLGRWLYSRIWMRSPQRESKHHEESRGLITPRETTYTTSMKKKIPQRILIKNKVRKVKPKRAVAKGDFSGKQECSLVSYLSGGSNKIRTEMH